MIMASSEKPDESQESPLSPNKIKESPDSPQVRKRKHSEEEEVWFIEDRGPGNQVSVHDSRLDNTFLNITEDFISFNTHKKHVNERDEEPTHLKTLLEDRHEVLMKNTEDDSLIIEDRTPQLSGQETQSPRYNINESYKVLQNPNASKKKSTLFNTCWNCGENSHALRDCKQPKDYNKISRCRQEFQEARSHMPVYKRYHVEESQKFAHLVPGELSKELRAALGLEPRQLPVHIYRMRRLGYPPGWLQDAVIPHSGISMFDAEGKEVSTPGTEGGEVLEDKYDARKIIHYPGFNVPPPEDTYDDSSYWNCPPMSRLQSVEVIMQRLGDRVVGAYKRKKMSMNTSLATKLDDTVEEMDSQDMEYEEVTESKELPVDRCGFVPPLPDEDLPPPPPEDLPSDGEKSTLLNDTTLTQLEDQKKQLLTVLNDVSPLCRTPESRIGKICSEDLGTTIIKSVSPYRRLPGAKNFSVNICDVINFENLPNSTGKYDQMSGIIKKVRMQLSKIDNEG